MITLLYIISEKRRIEPVHVFAGFFLDMFIVLMVGLTVGA